MARWMLVGIQRRYVVFPIVAAHLRTPYATRHKCL